MFRLLFSVLAALLLSVPTFAGYTTITQSVRAIQAPKIDSETMVRELRNICTTTSINSTEHFWLTAAHCVTGNELYIDGHRAFVNFKDVPADLAILWTPDYSLPSLKLRSTRPSVEQAIVLVGHPLGLPQVQVFRGRISSLRTWVDDGWYMLFDMTACGGNSGSAVVDSDDHIISVLQIGFGPGCSAFSGGAPWEVLARLVGKFFKQ